MIGRMVVPRGAKASATLNVVMTQPLPAATSSIASAAAGVDSVENGAGCPGRGKGAFPDHGSGRWSPGL